MGQGELVEAFRQRLESVVTSRVADTVGSSVGMLITIPFFIAFFVISVFVATFAFFVAAVVDTFFAVIIVAAAVVATCFRRSDSPNRTLRRTPRAIVAWTFDVVSILLPASIANEELGDAREVIEANFAKGCSKWRIYGLALSAVLWASINAVRAWSPLRERRGA